MNKQSIRLGVDIGGTFTDVVLEVDDTPYSTKVLTTYDVPENAIIQGIEEVCRNAGINPSDIQQIVHGTTLATNALIERRGAKTALITTQGFRDVIEMRTESRFEQYDLNLTLPEPLLPRNQRYTINERIAANGDVLLALKDEDVTALVEEIREGHYESIAIGLIHAYANSSHEEKIRDILAKKLPDLSISISSEVSPQMREYERFNTAVANAYIKPMMKSYLGRLRDKLAEINIVCPVFLMHSGGGIISIENAAEFPVRLVESGPAGGAVFAAHIAARYGLERVLSFDMGGTTAKICLIKNFTPKTSRVFEVARTYRFKKGSGMPISIPVIDMVEIGAGGGSLAHVDSMRQIRVGPESAGSEPGPACYGRGGKLPAVTDADLLLGRLDPDNFAGGSFKLNEEKAAHALTNQIASMLDVETVNGAFGVSEVVDENMANAARVHAVENGEDLSNYTIIAFGGAAPLHAARLCEKLNIDRLIIPPGAGVGSAIGFLRAPFSFEATKSLFMKLSEFDTDRACHVFSMLSGEAESFVRSCDKTADILSEYKVYMRYAGQGSEIVVDLPSTLAQHPNVTQLKKLFEEAYVTLFGRTVQGMDIEITVWAVNATTPPKPVKQVKTISTSSPVQSSKTRNIFDPALQHFVSADIFERNGLQAGSSIHGPAVVMENETTTILPSSRYAVMQNDGCIDVHTNSKKAN